MTADTDIFPAPGAHITARSLGVARGGRWLFRQLSWEVARGQVIAVVGRSGAGKSSLLACLGGLLAPDEGEVGFRCRAGCAHRAASYQPRIGIIFQDLALSLQSSVLDNVLCGRLGRYPWWRTIFGFPRADRAEAGALLAALGLGSFAHRRVADVSGGEQQRIAIGRALFQEPELLLADEPVSSLDPALARQVLGLLRAHAREHGRTLVCVLHDPALVAEFADHTLRLDPDAPDGWRWQPADASA